MTDKERILMMIITRIIPGVLYSSIRDRDDYAKSYMFEKDELQPGDLVFVNTSIYPNDFIVGFVDHIELDRGCVVIREIGSKRLCNYFNEGFTKINKEKLGYEFLERTEYKTYQKALKAVAQYTEYGVKFGGIQYDGKTCTIRLRKIFSNETTGVISFKHSSKTTIKEIGQLLETIQHN